MHRGENVAVSRRIFLQHGVLAAAATYVTSPLEGWGQSHSITGEGHNPPVHNSGPGGTRDADPYAALDSLDRQSFVSAIGSAFQVQTAVGLFWLRLLSVTDLAGPPAANPGTFAVLNKKVAKTAAVETAGFNLLFSGTSPDSVEQGTYTFFHATLGEFVLFIVPEAGRPGQYNAVINRFAAPEHSPAVIAPATGLPAVTGADGPSVPAGSTSSGSETPSPRHSETRGGQKGAVRD